MYRTLLHLIDYEKENTSLCGAVDARADDDVTSCQCLKCLDALILLTKAGEVDWLETIEAQRQKVIAADAEWEAKNKC